MVEISHHIDHLSKKFESISVFLKSEKLEVKRERQTILQISVDQPSGQTNKQTKKALTKFIMDDNMPTIENSLLSKKFGTQSYLFYCYFSPVCFAS